MSKFTVAILVHKTGENIDLSQLLKMKCQRDSWRHLKSFKSAEFMFFNSFTLDEYFEFDSHIQ
jgi:hypothetical protein